MKKRDQFYKEVPEFLTRLNRRWRLGDLEKKWGTTDFQCSDIPQRVDTIARSFLRCNEVYLRCYLRGKIKGLDPVVATKHFRFKALAESMKFVKNGDTYLEIKELITGKSFQILLENSCHESYLPQKVYSTGFRKKNPNLWDNWGQHIFIDEHYVTQYDVQKWKKGKIPSIGENSAIPSFDLNLKERKKYCAYRGKFLLASRVFDAAANFPMDKAHGYLFHSKYPWAKSNRLIFDEKNSKEHCGHIFSSECYRKYEDQYVNFADHSVSWNGIYHTLGDEMESFENTFNPKANLKVSNKKLPLENFWQQNFVRGYWDGIGFEQGNFEFIEQYSQKQHLIKTLPSVAFRCMSLK